MPYHNFAKKVEAIQFIAGSERDDLHVFAKDLETDNPKYKACKEHPVSTIEYVFKRIFQGNFPAPAAPGSYFYEYIHAHDRVAYVIDFDLPTKDVSLDCSPILLDLIGRVRVLNKRLFNIDTNLSNWIITKSPYCPIKCKHSFHLHQVGFFFDNVAQAKCFTNELGAEDLGVDDSIYRVGCLRLTGCTKFNQNRPLMPFQLVSPNGLKSLVPEDFQSHFDYFKAATMKFSTGGSHRLVLPPEVVQKQIKNNHKLEQITTTPHERPEPIDGSEQACQYNIPLELLQRVVRAFSLGRAEDRSSWCRVIWAISIVARQNDYAEAGLTLADAFSRNSTEKYSVHAVKKLFIEARTKGYGWPSLRGCLWEDDIDLWKALRNDPEYKYLMMPDKRHLYREQYMPHVDRFRDVITDVIEYESPHVPPYDLNKFKCIVDGAPPGTGKTLQYSKVILSGDYKSVLIVVNRQTLTRASLQRINRDIRKHMGHYDPTSLFRDYRRPDDVFDPLIPQDDEEVSKDAVASLAEETFPDFFSDDDQDEEAQAEAEMEAEARLEAEDIAEAEAEAEREQKIVHKTSLMDVPFLVIQVESLHRIAGRKYDLVIFDECESDLYQLSSPTMKRLKATSMSLFGIVRDAKKLLFLDAFMSDRTFILLQHIRFAPGTPICYRQNTWLPTGRKAIEIVADTTPAKRNLFIEAIASKLKAQQRVVLFTASRSFGIGLVKRIRRRFGESKKILFYERNFDGKLKDKHFDDVDRYWADVDLLIYTPVLLAGVSFNQYDHFNCIFVWGYSQSCHVRDMMQAACRVRHFQTQTMYYALDFKNAHSKRGLPVTLESVQADLRSRQNVIEKYHEQDKDEDMPGGATYVDPLGKLAFDLAAGPDPTGPRFTDDQKQKLWDSFSRFWLSRKMEEAPDWLLAIHIRNVLESNLTHNPVSIESVFLDFLIRTGWIQTGQLTKQDIQAWDKPRKMFRNRPFPISPISRPVDIPHTFTDIPNLSPQEYLDGIGRRDRGEASLIDNLGIEKFWFLRTIVRNPEESQAAEQVFNEIIDDSRKRQLMMNIFNEANSNPESMLDVNMDDNPFVQMLDTFPVVLGLIRRFCDELGLQSSHDLDSGFTSELLEAKKDTLTPLVDDLVRLMDIRTSCAKASSKRILGNLQNIFKAFSGCQFLKTRKRIFGLSDGTRPSFYHYKLQTLDSLRSFVQLTCLIVVPSDTI